MNILAFGSHPDDIELGCSGTLLKHIKKGNHVYLCVLSDGQEAGNPKIRRKEQELAAKRLGAKKLFWGNWRDGKFVTDNDAVAFIESIIKEVKPYEIYVNFIEDSHQDHRSLAQCVLSATRYNKRVLYYEDYTSLNFNPDIFVDIENVLDQKIEVLKSFKSQINKNFPSGPKMISGIKAIANFRGFQAKINYAEGFKAIRYLKLDMD